MGADAELFQHAEYVLNNTLVRGKDLPARLRARLDAWFVEWRAGHAQEWREILCELHDGRGFQVAKPQWYSFGAILIVEVECWDVAEVGWASGFSEPLASLNGAPLGVRRVVGYAMAHAKEVIYNAVAVQWKADLIAASKQAYAELVKRELELAARPRGVSAEVNAALAVGPRMARAVHPPIVYFVQESGGPVKIGTTTAIRNRVSALQTSTPRTLTFLGAVSGGERVERRVHELFGAHRLSGEWFSPHPDVLSFIVDTAEFDSIEAVEAKGEMP